MLSALRGADGGVRVLVSAAWVKHGAASLESSTQGLSPHGDGTDPLQQLLVIP